MNMSHAPQPMRGTEGPRDLPEDPSQRALGRDLGVLRATFLGWNADKRRMRRRDGVATGDVGYYEHVLANGLEGPAFPRGVFRIWVTGGRELEGNGTMPGARLEVVYAPDLISPTAALTYLREIGLDVA